MEAKNLIAKAEITVIVTANKAWEALTNPKQIEKYMFGTTVTSDWKKGSTITWKGEMDGKKYEDKGKILKIDPEKKLQYSHYSPLSKLTDKPENYHTVTIDLTTKKNKTSITLTQDKNGSEKGQKQSEKNWATMLEGLKDLLEK